MFKRMTRIVALLFCALILSVVAIAQTGAPLIKSSDSAADALIAQALGPSSLSEILRVLCDEIGGRQTGTPALERAVAWGVENFRKAGVDEVHTEKYTVPNSWQEGATHVEILSPTRFEVRAVSIAWAPATARGGIEAEVMDVGEGTASDFERLGETAHGAILLIRTRPLATLEDLFGEYLKAPGIIQRAVQAKASALAFVSTRPRNLLYRHSNTFLGQIDPLPMAILAREDALRVARFLELGQKVKMHLTLPNQVGGPFETENVVAEIRGSEKPDEVVILGAHLDSWALGTGALDNGCNAALVVDVARAMHDARIRPRRTVRFILFTGEEQGMLGSAAYVRKHRAEMDRMAAVVIFDEGVGRVSGYSLGGRKETESPLREILKPVEQWQSNVHTADAFIGTDNFDFLLEGVPTLVANQDPTDYLPNYHASSDTLDKVDLRELKVQEAFAAVTVYRIAQRPERIGKRLNRSEVEALLQETHLDEQLKTFGIWPDWENERRGRQR